MGFGENGVLPNIIWYWFIFDEVNLDFTICATPTFGKKWEKIERYAKYYLVLVIFHT